MTILDQVIEELEALIVAASNEKGGVTKTTTIAVLAVILQVILGFRVLVLDADPQANISNLFGYLREETPTEQTLFAVLRDGKPIEQVICKTVLLPDTMEFVNPRDVPVGTQVKYGPDLVRMNRSGVDADFSLKNKEYWNELLRDALQPVRRKYDYILIDCAPSLGSLTSNALTAAQFVLIPVVPERLVVEGLLGLLGVIKQARLKANPNLAVAGLFLSRTIAWNAHRKVGNDLRKTIEHHPDLQDLNLKLFTTEIKQNKAFAESLNRRSLIVLDDAENEHARVYWYLLDELLQRIGGPAREVVAQVVGPMKVQDQERVQQRERERAKAGTRGKRTPVSQQDEISD
jgi:chromosome partitioning protein